jgi:hypothetical protein
MTREEMVIRLIINVDTDSELLELVRANPEWEFVASRKWSKKDSKFHEVVFEHVTTSTDISLYKMQLLAERELRIK